MNSELITEQFIDTIIQVIKTRNIKKDFDRAAFRGSMIEFVRTLEWWRNITEKNNSSKDMFKSGIQSYDKNHSELINIIESLQSLINQTDFASLRNSYDEIFLKGIMEGHSDIPSFVSLQNGLNKLANIAAENKSWAENIVKVKARQKNEAKSDDKIDAPISPCPEPPPKNWRLLSDTDRKVWHSALVYETHIGPAGRSDDGPFARFCEFVLNCEAINPKPKGSNRQSETFNGDSAAKSISKLRRLGLLPTGD
jgi:hypothetical protein